MYKARPTTPPPLLLCEPPSTPYTLRSLRIVWKKVLPLAQEVYKDNKEAIDIFMKFARGSSANMHTRLQAEREFANTQAVTRAHQ